MEKGEIGQEVKTVIGPDGEALAVSVGLVLGIERFLRPVKHYRLIWVLKEQAWLCEEERTEFRRVWGEGGVVEAGRKLAESLGVKFSGVTR